MFLLQKIHLNMTETLKAEYWTLSSILGGIIKVCFLFACFLLKTKGSFQKGVGLRELTIGLPEV